MCVFYALRSSCCTAGIRQTNDILLIISLSLQSLPSFAPGLLVIFQTLQYRFVKGSAEFALDGIGVKIDYEGDCRLGFAEVVEERNEFSVDDYDLDF
jgi:hypothetical protein